MYSAQCFWSEVNILHKQQGLRHQILWVSDPDSQAPRMAGVNYTARDRPSRSPNAPWKAGHWEESWGMNGCFGKQQYLNFKTEVALLRHGRAGTSKLILYHERKDLQSQ